MENEKGGTAAAEYNRLVAERAGLYGQLCEAKRRKDSGAVRVLRSHIDAMTRRMGELC